MVELIVAGLNAVLLALVGLGALVCAVLVAAIVVAYLFVLRAGGR